MAGHAAAALAAAEAADRPRLFRGLVAHWPAVVRWQGPDGLRHLRAIAGDAPVQAMYSRHGPAFHGNIEAHQPVRCRLAQLLDLGLRLVDPGQPRGDDADEPDAVPYLYLAQQELCPGPGGGAGGRGASQQLPPPTPSPSHRPVPRRAGSGLEALLQDAPMPALLAGRDVAQTNLWMSLRRVQDEGEGA